MYEREHHRWQLWVHVGGLGHAPWRNFDKSVQLGAFWHIFMQFISWTESIFNQRQMGKMNKDVISSLLKSFPKRTCTLVHDYIRCAIGKAVLWICKEHNYLPFCTDWSFVFRSMITLIPKYSLYNLFKSLPIPCSYIYTPKFESDLVGKCEERRFGIHK